MSSALPALFFTFVLLVLPALLMCMAVRKLVKSGRTNSAPQDHVIVLIVGVKGVKGVQICVPMTSTVQELKRCMGLQLKMGVGMQLKMGKKHLVVGECTLAAYGMSSGDVVHAIPGALLGGMEVAVTKDEAEAYLKEVNVKSIMEQALEAAVQARTREPM